MRQEAITDDELMRRLRAGSRDGFRELIRRWERPLRRFFRLSGLDAHSSEDCAQETFLRLFAYRDRYECRGSSFRAFLFRLARNVSVDHFRRMKNRRAWLSVEELDDEPATCVPACRGIERFDVLDALAALPSRLRVVIVVHLFAGLTYRETAAVLEIPLGTVKSRVHHALRQLREVLRVDADL